MTSTAALRRRVYRRRLARSVAPLATVALFLGTGLAVGAVGAATVLAADPPYTGFMVDSETGNPFGGGQLHDHFPSTPTATGTSSDLTVSGGGWTFEFQRTGGLGVGSYADGVAIFRLGRNGTFCSSNDWTFEVLEAPVSVDGVITQFAVDFWRNRCGSATGHAIFGSIRIGSSTPIEMLHVTSALDFPDTFEGEIAPDQIVQVFNAGDTTIDVEPLVRSGPNGVDFPTTDGCGPVALDPGQECSIAVGFAPSGTTQRSATVTIPASAYGPDRQVDLTGYGLSTILKTPSALVIDGQPGAFTDGDHWFDPVSMTATGNDHDVTIKALEWEARFRTADGAAFEPGTYVGAELIPGGGNPGLLVTRGLRLCSEPYDGSFTILEAPVIDADGTILRFAADFLYSCPQLNGHEARGWIRFHSDAARPTEEPLSYYIEIDTGSAAHIGETITLTPNVSGTDFLDAHRCQMVIESGDPLLDWVRMQVASDGCEPWTVTVPPSPIGPYRVTGWLRTAHGGTESTITAPNGGFDIGPGTPTTFATNYPVQSWAAADLISDATPSFGSPVTVNPPPGLDGCRLSIFAGYESAVTYQDGGCSPWTLTVPAPTPEFVAPFFGDRTDVRVVGWEGDSDWSVTGPDTPLLGARYGETYNGDLARFDGEVGGSYASNLPAIFTDGARANVYYTDDSTSHDFVPVVVGADGGSCTSDRQPLTRPVVAGACGSFTVPPTTLTGNVTEAFRVELRDTGGAIIAESSTDIGFVDHLSPLTVDVPDGPAAGQPFEIAADSATGAPAAYVITVVPAVDAAVAAVAPGMTYSGTLQPALGSGGGGVSVDAEGLAVGTWDVNATFTDVLGAATSGTERIVVTADTTPPTGTISIAGGATRTKTRAVLLSTVATDAASGVTHVALSNDGATWTERPYVGTQAWTLPPANGKRTVYAKWRDAAGNWSSVASDTILLDTVVPTATAPSHRLVSGSAISSGRTTVRLTWTGTDATSGVARYELAQSTDGGAWTTVSSALGVPTIDRPLAPSHTYRFRVRAVDRAGNTGAWMNGPTFRLTAYSEANGGIRYTGTWTTSSSTVYWGGRVRSSSRAGARATISVTGRSVEWVARKGPTRGRAQVYVNGVLTATVDLYASSYQNQRVAWAANWSTSATRTISIRVLGTSSRPRVDVDAFVVGS
jgi:hypothetical protein